MSTEGLPSAGRRAPDSDGGRQRDFRIEGRLVSPELNRVVTARSTVQLEPKVMRVLTSLAQRPGELVTKEQLFEEVWEGTHVTEDVLTRAIGELRRVFEDDASRPRVIETIRKSGYRLIARVSTEPVDSPAAAEARSPSVQLAPRRRSAALLVAGALGLAAILAVVALTRRHAVPTSSMRVRPLTSYPGSQRDPAVSPDGSRVAFVWNGGSGDAYSVYVKLTDMESELRLTREPGVQDRAPAWSPDGQRLAFSRLTAKSCDVLLVSSLGGAERSLMPCADRDYIKLAWSPDGRWIARARRDPSSQLSIELVSPDTLERRLLTHPPPGILGDSSPVFSPDGRTLAFARNVTDGVSDVFGVPVAGGEPTRLTFDNRDTMGIDWTEDGQSVLFSSSRAGIYSLWRVPAAGGEPIWVAGGGMKMKHPTTARSRSVIAYENWLYEVNLWRVDAEAAAGQQSAKLTETTDQWNFGPHISPDGRHIAFVSTRSGNQEIWLSGSHGEEPRRLTSFDGARLETPVWSPEGQRILFSARRQTVAELYSVGVSGGVVEQWTSETVDAVAPSWAHDGRNVYFASRRSGSWQIWKLELASRRLSPVTTDGGYASRESPDGKWLYFTRADHAGIWRQPTASGAAERVWERLAPEDWANWQVGPAGVYFRELCARHTEPGVALLAIGSSKPTDLVALDEQGWSDFDVSPDGRWVVYPRVDRHTCDIRLIENAY